MAKAFQLKNDSIFLLAESPGGLYNPEQLQAIASICDQENLIVKTTEDQRLGMIIPVAQREKVEAAMTAIGLVTRDYQSGLHQAVSCLGSHCPLAQQDALSTATELSKSLRDLTLNSPLKIGINGCSNCCVPTHTLDVSLIGEENGYRVSLGGKTSQIPEMGSFIAEGVPAQEVVALIRKAIEVYQSNAQDSESLEEVMQRAGSSPFVEAFAPFSQDAAVQEDLFASLPTAAAEEETFNIDEIVDPSTTLDTVNKEALMSDSAEEAESLPDVTIDDGTTHQDVDISLDFDAGAELVDEVLIQDASEAPLEFTEADLTPTDVEATASAPVEDSLALIDEPTKILDDQEALEFKLEESIAEQEAIGEIPKDENLSDRDDAFANMEHARVASSSEVDSIDQITGSFSNLDSLDDDIAEVKVGDFSPPTDEMLDDQNVIRMIDTSQIGQIESININDEFLNISFSQGATVNIDIGWLRDHGGKRDLKINGQDIHIRMTAQGLKINFDGMEIQMPEISLAA